MTGKAKIFEVVSQPFNYIPILGKNHPREEYTLTLLGHPVLQNGLGLQINSESSLAIHQAKCFLNQFFYSPLEVRTLTPEHKLYPSFY